MTDGPDRPAACQRIRLLAGWAAAFGMWLLLAACTSAPPITPFREGPATQPDGEFRDLQSAISGGNIGWVGQMLAPELLPLRRDRVVGARRELASRLIDRLGELFRQGVVITGQPTVEEQLDASGAYVGSVGTVEATITRVNTHDGGRSLEEWFRAGASDTASNPDGPGGRATDDLPPPVPPTRMATRWRDSGTRWVLTGLAVEWPDGRRWELTPVLDATAPGNDRRP